MHNELGSQLLTYFFLYIAVYFFLTTDYKSVFWQYLACFSFFHLFKPLIFVLILLFSVDGTSQPARRRGDYGVPG